MRNISGMKTNVERPHPLVKENIQHIMKNVSGIFPGGIGVDNQKGIDRHVQRKQKMTRQDEGSLHHSYFLEKSNGLINADVYFGRLLSKTSESSNHS